MKKWLLSKPCLSIRCLEKQAGLPKGTLTHYLTDRRELNDSHKEKLIPALKQYGYRDYSQQTVLRMHEFINDEWQALTDKRETGGTLSIAENSRLEECESILNEIDSV